MPRFHPTELPDLTLWLGPAAIGASNDLLDGEAVADWPNLYDIANAFSQATATQRPTFLMAQRWRFPAVDFDGASEALADQLEGGAFTNYVTNSVGTFYVAFKPDSISVQQYLLHNTGDTMRLRITTSGQLQAGNQSGGSFQVANFSGVRLNEWNIGIWKHGGAQISVGLNGTRLISNSSGATDGGSGNMQLGAGSIGADAFNGQIGEVLAYASGHGELNLGKVLSYLASRWQDRGDPHEQAREAASRRMVFLERPRKIVDGAVSLFGADFRPLQKVAVTAPLLASPGAGGDGTQPWERRVLSILERDIRYRDREVDLRLGDTREQAHTYRDSGVSTKIADPKGEGRMISGRVMYRNVTRRSNAWVESDAGTVYQIGPGVERAESRGVLFESAVTNILLRSSFVSGTAGLALTLNGGTIVADTGTPRLFVSSVTPNRGKITTALGDTYFTHPNTVDQSNGRESRLSIDYLNVGSDQLQIRVQRTGDSKYLKSDGTWQVGSVWITLPLSATTIGRHFTPRFVNDSGGNAQYIVDVGFEAGASGRIAYVFHDQIAGPDQYARSVNDSTMYVGSLDGAWLYNGEAGNRIWPNDSCTLLVRCTPAWEIGDLAGNLMSIVNVTHDDPAFGVGTEYARLVYNSDPLQEDWFFEVAAGGSSWSAAWPHFPVRLTEYAIAARMVGLGGSDIGLPAGHLSIFLDGVIGEFTDVRSANPTEGINSRIWIGNNPTTFGGWLRDLQIVPCPMTNEEILRWSEAL